MSKGEQVAEVMALRVMYVEDDCIRPTENVFRPPTKAIMLLGGLVASHYHLELNFGRNKSNPEHHNRNRHPRSEGIHTEEPSIHHSIKKFRLC